MNVLRRVLPKSWFDNVDYDTSENIDWMDDYDPNEPRVPKGSPGGGQWTVSGAGAGPAPALTKYAGPFGAKMQNAVNAHINGIGISDPQELAKHIIAGAGQFKSTNVAGYANQLLHHLAKHYGVPLGTFGKAVKKIDGEAIDLPDTPPTDADMDKMAAQAGHTTTQAFQPGEVAEPPAEPAGEIKPLALPPGDHHPNLALIGDIANYEKTKWPAKEKIEWMKTLLADIPADDTAAQTYAQAQIATLEGNVASWASPAAPATPAAPLTPKEAWATGLGPEPPSMAEPDGGAQKSILDILNGPLDNATKLEKLKQKLDIFTKTKNKEYAKQAIAILQGKTGPVGAAATSAPAIPEPLETTSTQTDLHAIATDPSTTTEQKIKSLKQDIATGYQYQPNLTYAHQLLAALGGTPDPGVVPKYSPTAQTSEAAESEALVKQFPAPGMYAPAQGEMWDIATQTGEDPWVKAGKIQQKISEAWKPEDIAYGEKLKQLLTGVTPAAGPTAEPDPLDKLLTPEQQHRTGDDATDAERLASPR